MLNLPAEHELIGFFESEPELLDTEMDTWDYNELTFRTQRGQDRLVVRISPGWGDLSLSWEKAGQRLLWMKLANLESLQVEMQKNDELLIASGTHADQTGMLKLRLKPEVAIEFEQLHTP